MSTPTAHSRLDPERRGAEFDEFYRSSFSGVYRIALAISGEPSVAEDLAQEGFLEAQRRWTVVSEYDRPDLWVRRVVINRARSWRRRRLTEIAAIRRVSARRGVEVDLQWSGDAELWREVRRLPSRQASLIALVYVDDLSIEQAAHVLDIGVPTAKTHLQRARRRLALRLKEDLDDR